MKCKSCQQEIPRNSKFCPECGRPQEKQKTTSPRVEVFSTSEVIISEMLADVQVNSSDRDDVQVTISGDEEIKNTARLELSGSTLKISADLPFKEGGTGGLGGKFNRIFSSSSISITRGSVISTGGGINIVNDQINIVNDQIIINGRAVDTERKIFVTVEVPKGTTIKVGKLFGKAVIGDTEGDLHVKAKGSTRVNAGKIQSLYLDISGSADVRINEVSGDVEVVVSGSGDVDIRGGHSKSFNVRVSGSGDVKHRGVSDAANLRVSGSGDITLGECLSVPVKSVSGSGDINIHKAPVSRGFDNDW